MSIAAISPISGLSPLGASSPASSSGAANFLDVVNAALQGVSDSQNSAANAEAGYATGVSGATLGAALVASDKAEVAWNAAVAVRNEVVSAYSTVMNMQF